MSSSGTSSDDPSASPTTYEDMPNRVLAVARVRGADSELTLFLAKWVTVEQVLSLSEYLKGWKPA